MNLSTVLDGVFANASSADDAEPALLSLNSRPVNSMRSFLQSHWPGTSGDFGTESFMGEIPGVGAMIALSNLVSKNELDRIRHAFATTFRKISPTNSAVKLVA